MLLHDTFLKTSGQIPRGQDDNEGQIPHICTVLFTDDNNNNNNYYYYYYYNNSTGGMADECKRFHSRLAELLALKKGDDYATTISWIRAKVSFAILRSALLCLRGTRRKRRPANISDIDITSESAQARI